MTEMLDIVNEHDEVIGQAERDEIHARGLACRMVFVCFYTPDKQIILQRRSKTKKILPNMLTTTVSGHVERGMTYDETAIKETLEETGVVVDPDKLISLGVKYSVMSDVAMRASYIYPYDDSIDDLKIEEGAGGGFEIMSIDELKRRRIEDPKELTPYLLSELATNMINKIEKQLS